MDVARLDSMNSLIFSSKKKEKKNINIWRKSSKIHPIIKFLYIHTHK